MTMLSEMRERLCHTAFRLPSIRAGRALEPIRTIDTLHFG
jgi:hypothetical protein